MRQHPAPWFALVVLLGWSLPAPARADLEADVDRGEQLLSEGDALADRGETTEALLRYKQAIEQLLPGLRGLPFKHEVKRDVTPREDLRKVVLQELDEE